MMFGRSIRTQLCLTLCNPMVCSPTGSSVHGISQARILEWVAMPFSRGSSQPRDQTWGLLHCRQFLYHLSHQGILLNPIDITSWKFSISSSFVSYNFTSLLIAPSWLLRPSLPRSLFITEELSAPFFLESNISHTEK